MKRRLTVICLTSLLIYSGWVLAYKALNPPPSGRMGIEWMERAQARTGAHLELARFSVVEPVADVGQAERLRARLGWADQPAAGERRSLEVRTEQGVPVLNLEWRLTGGAAQDWPERHRALLKAMTKVGIRAPVHVQLESRTAGETGVLLELVNEALDGVEARQRQPWADGRAASVAGWSDRLPPGPYEVNIQVAARQVADGTRFWIAWPALASDY